MAMNDRWRRRVRRTQQAVLELMAGESPLRPRSWVLDFGLAVTTVAVALLITALVAPLREQPPSLLFIAAVILTSFFAGLWAGFTASMLSMLVLAVFFLRPAESWQARLVEDGADFAAFAAATWLVSTLQSRWRKLNRKLVSIARDLLIARRIQQHFFPVRAPHVEGFDIGGACFPAADTGGDFFDYIPLSDGRLGIVIGDVSGHGVAAALVMALVRAYVRAAAAVCNHPGQILTTTNKLVQHDVEVGWFATVLLACVRPESLLLEYASAGHQGLLLDGRGELRELCSTGLVLGVRSDTVIEDGPQTALEPGDVALLLSDGVLESRSAKGELFGMQRVAQLVQARRQQPAETIVSALYRAVREHGRGVPQDDDVTIIVIKAQPAAPPA